MAKKRGLGRKVDSKRPSAQVMRDYAITQRYSCSDIELHMTNAFAEGKLTEYGYTFDEERNLDNEVVSVLRDGNGYRVDAKRISDLLIGISTMNDKWSSIEPIARYGLWMDDNQLKILKDIFEKEILRSHE